MFCSSELSNVWLFLDEIISKQLFLREPWTIYVCLHLQIGSRELKINRKQHVNAPTSTLIRGRGTVTVRSPVTEHPTFFRGSRSRLATVGTRGALNVTFCLP